ncbi:S-layer homology domain-containing protein [Paenibacillus guangzhouensis]|uniref:S-layer homology domain-containing protein n=1 Tax=Paenibacillus guangzhouensis TaxID=1473112 RepID=UPI0012674913|nr:S-layer homology domain-containing protein [Paenibacillus guangzhouensis]
MKKIVAMLMIICLVLSMAPGVSLSPVIHAQDASPTNLVQNAGFEDGTEHWRFDPPDKAGVSKNAMHAGQFKGWVDPSTTDSVYAISQEITIPDSGIYALSAYAANYQPGGSMAINGKAYPFEAYGGSYVRVELPNLPFRKGEKATITFTSGLSGWLNIDDVSLVPTSRNLLAEVQFDGQPAASYNLFDTDNSIVLPKGTAQAPQVSARLEEWAVAAGAELSIEQATELPGEAKIQVTMGGVTTTHTISFNVMSNDRPLQSIIFSASETTLPLDGLTKLSLTGILEDGSQIDLLEDPFTRVEFDAPGRMFMIGAHGEARAGTYKTGDVEVKVKATREGRVFTDTLTFTIKPEPARPYVRDYTQTLTMKLFLGSNGKIDLNLEEALDIIKRMDNMTRGIPKIIYLVGWQHDGHDSKYPDWNVVNPGLKRAQDATALDSLKWLMDEADQYNTTVSLHINMTDAYKDSPQWDEFMAKDLIRRQENGDLIEGGKWVSGQSYRINLTRTWEAGVFQRNIDQLLDMLPHLRKGGTIHIDAFVTNYVPGEPNPDAYSDPYHKTTFRQDTETQKKIIRYWRDQGLDFTSEYFVQYRGDPLYGLQPMAWWADWWTMDQMDLPAKVAVGGRGGNELLGISMHGEDIVAKDKERLTGFLPEFMNTTLVWQYLNQLDRISYDSATNTVQFSEGVTSSKSGDIRTVKQGDVMLADGTDVFVPALWRKDAKEIIAFSQKGYENRSWKLPADWAGVEKVHLFEIGMGLPRLIQKDMAVVDGHITLSLQAGEGVYMIPATGDPIPMDPIQDMAAGMTAIPAPAKNAIALTLPSVPAGYEVRIAKSDRMDVIDLLGKIVPPTEDTPVSLVLELKRQADGITTHTAPITVVAPEGTIKNIKITYSPADAVLTGDSKLRSSNSFMKGYAIGYVGGSKDNTAAYENVVMPGDSLYDVQLEYATAVPRSVFLRINEQEGIEVPLTGPDWNTPQYKTIQVALNKGINRITLYNNDGHAPDMGAVTISSVSPYMVANAITSIPAPAKGDKALTLPKVPFGFTVSVKSSDHDAIIQSNGKIVPPTTDTTVKVILEITRNYDGSQAATQAIDVVVPGVVQIVKVDAVSVETMVDKAPVLPTSVMATYSDQSQMKVDVAWDSIQPSRYAAAGTFEVNGTIAGTAIRAVAKVTVKPSDSGHNGGGGSDGSGSNSNSSGTSTVKPEVKPVPETKPEPSGQVIEIPFQPSAEQLSAPGYVSVVKVNQDGSKTPVVFSIYDPQSGIVKVRGSKTDVYEVVYTPKKFRDLAKFAWAEEAIETLAASGVWQGISTDQFGPQQGLKRGDLVKMLVNLFQLTADTDANFSDVNKAAYYYEEVAIAKKLGLIQGMTATAFKPEAEVTREQFMVIVERFFRQQKLISSGANETVLDAFADHESIAGYAKSSVAALVELNLIQGSNDQLLPRQIANRAEAAMLLYRIIHFSVTKSTARP